MPSPMPQCPSPFQPLAIASSRCCHRHCDILAPKICRTGRKEKRKNRKALPFSCFACAGARARNPQLPRRMVAGAAVPARPPPPAAVDAWRAAASRPPVSGDKSHTVTLVTSANKTRRKLARASHESTQPAGQGSKAPPPLGEKRRARGGRRVGPLSLAGRPK